MEVPSANHDGHSVLAESHVSTERRVDFCRDSNFKRSICHEELAGWNRYRRGPTPRNALQAFRTAHVPNQFPTELEDAGVWLI